MKYLIQFAIIGGITFLGEVLNMVLPFSVPASVYGLLLLFLALVTGLIKLEHIEETADFFVNIMPVLFIAPAVSMVDVLPGMKGSIVAIFVISVITTVLVMTVTGLVSQLIIRFGKKKGSMRNE